MRETSLPADVATDRPERFDGGVSPSSMHGDRAAGSALSTLPARAGTLVRGLGEDFAEDSRRLEELSDRLAGGRFHLAVLGQFKRGKSTLLNALLGEAVLPTAIVPLTAVPTFIRPSHRLSARVTFQSDRSPEEFVADDAERLNAFLARFVTESGNPSNRLGVLQVEVTHPADILGKGVVLIDTPGIGSTFRHNTEATLNFLPQCDAALFLVSADPPITEVEVDFLKQVRTKVPRLFFILNKVDYLDDDDRQVALDFLRRVLSDQAGIDGNGPIFCVSARQGLKARRDGDETLRTASGLAQVERHLVDFLANEKSAALREAIGRKAADVLAGVLLRLRLAMRSLRMPLEELRRRLELFEAKIDEAQRQRVAARDLLAGDRRRMHEFLEQYAERLRAKAREYLGGIVRESLACNDRAGEEPVKSALAKAIPGYFEHLSGATDEVFRDRMAEALRPHQKRADELIESVRRAAAELFEVPYRAPESADAFEMVRRPCWVTHKWSGTLSPIPVGLIDRLAPQAVRRQRVRRRLMDQAAQLVVPNVESLRWATFQSIDGTFERFASTLDRRLAETVAATHGAISAAMTRRRNQNETTAKEASRLEAAIAEIERLQNDALSQTNHAD